MNPYESKSIKHVGRCAYRTKTNLRERVFAEEWAAQQKSGHTLQWLLCASTDQQMQERELTQVEATAVATFAQWLGSPVGSCWLEDTLRKAKRAEGGER